MKYGLCLIVLSFSTITSAQYYNNGNSYSNVSGSSGYYAQPMGGQKTQQTDYTCASKCRNEGMSYDYCQSKCSY